jgi:hypothetical protein
MSQRGLDWIQLDAPPSLRVGLLKNRRDRQRFAIFKVRIRRAR